MPASLDEKPIEPVSELSAWSAPLLRSPSQRSIGWLIELNTVGECRDVRAPRASGEKRRRSAPQSRAGWQLAHAVLSSAEARVSQKNARPRSACGDVLALACLICPNSRTACWCRASSARAGLIVASAATANISLFMPPPLVSASSIRGGGARIVAMRELLFLACFCASASYATVLPYL